MRMAGNNSAQVAVLHRKVEAGARLELSDVSSVKLLPGRVVPQRWRLKRGSALFNLLLADEYIHPAATKIHAYQVTSP